MPYIATEVSTFVSYVVTTTPTQDFVIPFPFDDIDDLRVLVNDAEATFSVVSGVIEDAFYTAGTCRLTASVTNATVVIFRRGKQDQKASFPINGPVSSAILTRELARIWMGIQDLQGQVDLTFRGADGQQLIPPLGNAADRANKLLYFDQSGNPVLVNPYTFNTLLAGLRPETYAILAATAPQPTATQTAIDTCIGALITAGVWAKQGALWVHMANDEATALINWKNPGTLTGVNTNGAGFAVGDGFRGNGSNAWISYGAYNAIPVVSRFNAHVAAWCSIGSQTSGPLVGMAGTDFTMLGRNGSAFQWNLSTSAATSPTSFSNTSEFVSANRAGGATVDIRQNKLSDGSYSWSSDIAVPATVFAGLRNNAVYATNGRALRAVSIGTNMTTTEFDALYDALNTYAAHFGV
jgi:hypothetical protein